MTDNTLTVWDYLDQVAERLLAQGLTPRLITFTVASRLAHSCMPFDRPYIAIHMANQGIDLDRMFPGDNAHECMNACEEWLTQQERKAA